MTVEGEVHRDRVGTLRSTRIGGISTRRRLPDDWCGGEDKEARADVEGEEGGPGPPEM